MLQEDITKEMIPFVSIFPNSMSTARACGMSTITQTVEKGLQFYAEKVPNKEINASLLLLRATGGSGSYINNVATAEDVAEMLDEVFQQ